MTGVQTCALPIWTRVVVVGSLRMRSYETRDGEKRTVYEIEADEVAPSLRWAKASLERQVRSDGSGSYGGGGGGFSGGGGGGGGDWNAAAPSAPTDEETPFDAP